MRTFVQSFRFALQGLSGAWRTQRNFRLLLAAAVGLVGVILIVRPGRVESGLLVLAASMVLMAELINTAVEVIVDRLVLQERHPAAKVAKDMAAAAVLVAAIGAAVVSLIVLGGALR